MLEKESLMHHTFVGCKSMFLPMHFVFGRVRKFAEKTLSFVMSVCPSAWNNSAPTGRIFVKFNS